jgi:hypothetical protein
MSDTESTRCVPDVVWVGGGLRNASETMNAYTISKIDYVAVVICVPVGPIVTDSDGGEKVKAPPGGLWRTKS